MRGAAELDHGRPGPVLLDALTDPALPDLPAVLWAAVPFAESIPTSSWSAALSHPLPAARAAAAAGLAASVQPPAPDLLRALAAASDASTRAALLRSIAALPPRAAAPAFQTALEIGTPADVAAACLGLAAGNTAASATPYAAIAQHLAGESATPRPACAFALSVLPVPADPSARDSLGLDLLSAVSDPDPEVRITSLVALQRYPVGDPGPLQTATGDPDWRVAAQTFRTLALHAPPDLYLSTLEAYMRQVRANPDGARGPRLRVWEAALRAAAPFAQRAESVSSARSWLEQLTADWLDGPSNTPLAAAHCEVAHWLDQGHGWPGSLRACGDGQVPALSLHHEATLIAAQPTDPALRASYLIRLLQRAPDAAHSVLQAASRVHHRSLVDPVLDMLRRAAPPDAGRAARALADLAPTLQRDDHATRDAAQSALLAALRRFQPRLPVPSLLAILDASIALNLPGMAPSLLPLANHPSPDVRALAVRYLRDQPDRLEIPGPPALPGGSPLAPPSGTVSISLQLDRGEVRIELDPGAAPASTARLLQAISAGWLADATLIPAPRRMELAIGDPYRPLPAPHPVWLRREPSNRLFERGSVGLVRTGATSSSLALFVTFSRRPELDAGPTWVGRVTRGLTLLEGAIHGERVKRATRLEAPPQPR